MTPEQLKDAARRIYGDGLSDIAYIRLLATAASMSEGGVKNCWYDRRSAGGAFGRLVEALDRLRVLEDRLRALERAA